MDAYDHVAQATIRSSALPLDTPTASGTVTPNTAPSSSSAAPTSVPSTTSPEAGTLSSDLQDAYTSFSTSAWGARIGGFLGSVRKSGESVISGVRNEASIASEEAFKGFGELRKELVGIGNDVRKRGMSLVASEGASSSAEGDKAQQGEGTSEKTGEASTQPSTTAQSADSEGFVARLRAEAEKRIKDLQNVEDAADEALLKFGSNIRNFLRDAVTVSAPEAGDGSGDQPGQVLFESKDAEGKRVIHTTRFDAQLHVIHCSLDSFLNDPASAEYSTWKKDFSVDKNTDDIANNLQKYEELRRAMEKLVPERVDYNTFWTRYYFLRMVIESEEKRRKEMLKGAAFNSEEEVAWDEDSDEEPSTPQPKAKSKSLSESSPEIVLGHAESHKSGDQHSQPDSDASYDLISGATSRAPGSPKEDREKEADKTKPVETGKAAKDDSDEEDWE